MSWPWWNLKYVIGVFLDGLRKNAENLSQHTQYFDRNFNPGPANAEDLYICPVFLFFLLTLL